MRRLVFVCVLVAGAAACSGNSDGDVGPVEGFVCGTDGSSYTVEQAADGDHDIAHRGRCDEPMDCHTPRDCFAGDACDSAVCVPSPSGCQCPGVFSPVCASDGQTYINACEAHCVDLDILFDGMCEPDRCALIDCAPGYTCQGGECVPDDRCVCPELYAPVCGADGKTYSNSCFAGCAGVDIVGEGECDGCQDDGECEPDEICIDWPESEPSYCVWIGCDSDEQCRPGERCVIEDVCRAPAVVGPCDAAFPRWFYSTDTEQCEQFTWGGCGGNGNNFETRDECEAACPVRTVPKLSLAPRAGVCQPDVFCPEGLLAPEIYAPVCGVDGVTYGNPCHAEQAGVDIAYNGECIDEVTCMNQGCPDGWTCDYCQLSSGPRYICLSPLAGACLPPND